MADLLTLRGCLTGSHLWSPRKKYLLETVLIDQGATAIAQCGGQKGCKGCGVGEILLNIFSVSETENDNFKISVEALAREPKSAYYRQTMTFSLLQPLSGFQFMNVLNSEPHQASEKA